MRTLKEIREERKINNPNDLNIKEYDSSEEEKKFYREIVKSQVKRMHEKYIE